MSGLNRILADPGFSVGVEEFADAAETVATSMRAFQLLLAAGVEPVKLQPHLTTALSAANRMNEAGERLGKIINA